ncbi:MAG: hypothetical protein ACP5D9_08550 [Mariniphaga sp.]
MEDGEAEEIAFEGEVTRVVSESPEGRSAFEVFRNYRMAYKNGGFEILYECLDNRQACMKCVSFMIDDYKYPEKAGMKRDAKYLFANLSFGALSTKQKIRLPKP